MERSTRARRWLLDRRGRRYRVGPAVAFQVYYQPGVGLLWSRVFRAGVPLRVPASISREEFLAAVDRVPGSYQLQPLDAAGQPIGDPPAVIEIPAVTGLPDLPDLPDPALLGRAEDESGPLRAL
ncbi:MAG: hypothetical protein KBD62_21695 [Kofleriaceae bacterium]|nr:hypothetical protein [Kofleriaceae bacterium]